MFCQKCGNELKDDATFCNKCGAKVDSANHNISVSQESNKKPSPMMIGIIVVAVLLILIVFWNKRKTNENIQGGEAQSENEGVTQLEPYDEIIGDWVYSRDIIAYIDENGITYEGIIKDNGLNGNGDWTPRYCSRENTSVGQVEGKQAVIDNVNNIALVRSFGDSGVEIINLYIYWRSESRYQLWDTLGNATLK